MIYKQDQFPIIGWREWVALPELGIKHIKAKIDTGARSSSLHAFDIEPFQHHGHEWVRFKVLPVQRKEKRVIEAKAKVFDNRSVRSSSGESQIRPVIKTSLQMLGHVFDIELTLADRNQMGFRMLLGREAFRRRFFIDPGKSYLGGVPRKRKHKQ
ncbi:ATP-dependent zinc protease [Stieleria sp. TO1_6]|nr:ATP-dependent zinc protease [Stieleria tagensis]